MEERSFQRRYFSHFQLRQYKRKKQKLGENEEDK